MANCIGYEEILVDRAAVGPTESLVKGGVACAVFYVDPRAKGRVRWSPKAKNETDYPTPSSGFPLGPGKSISVAGEGNIRNSKFAMDAEAKGNAVRVYCLYFDRVDLIAADFTEGSAEQAEGSLMRIETDLADILQELRRHTEAFKAAVEDDLEAATS